MKNINIFLFISLFIFSYSSYAAGKYYYPEDARALTLKIEDTLISEGVCKARNNCGGKEFVFFRGGAPHEIYISVFRSNDLKPSIISEIIELCAEAYYHHDKKMTVNLKIYTETIKERNAWFSGVRPFINLKMKGLLN